MADLEVRRRAAPATWDPFSEFRRLSEEMNRLMDQTFGSLAAGVFTPAADIEETDDAYIVEVEVPGVAKDDIDVEVQGRRVVISGERKERERKGVLRSRSRTVGRFRYEALLPGEIVEDDVSADLGDGVLTVTLPKSERERPRRIKVR